MHSSQLSTLALAVKELEGIKDLNISKIELLSDLEVLQVQIVIEVKEDKKK